MEIFEILSPILINPKSTSITIGISRRFFLFQLIKLLSKRIEDDPYLNFISLLKHYKILGKFLHGNIHEFHRDRNKIYFKHFFINSQIYRAVKEDVEWVYRKNPKLKMTITKWGVIVYDNYKPNSFNTLLITIHSGQVMPPDIARRQTLSLKQREILEDTDIHKIYSGLVLDKGGIWIDTKLSRFACDYNRPPDRAIYSDGSEKWFDLLWKQELTRKQRKWLMEGYNEFYFTLSHLIESYRFNLIFDGHSMKDAPDRPGISFGTKYVPRFYMPVVRSMQRKIRRLGYDDITFNKPFYGGYILEWLHNKFPDVFIFSMEVNKRLYTKKNKRETNNNKIKKLAADVNQIFDMEEDEIE
jgi:N-formylglutamate amidohydrolase